MSLALAITFNVNSTRASTSFFYSTLFNNVLFAILQLNPGNILHLSRLKAWLPMVASDRPLKMATIIYVREIGVDTVVA